MTHSYLSDVGLARISHPSHWEQRRRDDELARSLAPRFDMPGRLIEKATQAYVDDRIDVDELEQRIERALRYR